MQHEVEDFFARFNQAINSADVEAFRDLYAESFMFGGTAGTQIVEREGFLKLLPRMKAHYASMGLFERQGQTVEAQPLAPNYLLAKVAWRMGIQLASRTTHAEIFATYVLSRTITGTLCIIFQIDHQDLTAVIKREQGGIEA